MHIAIITAGGAGMYCGSCMHDNTWARGLIELGETVTLIPTYTPIRVDEQDTSVAKVFLGGVNVYLKARSRAWRLLPNWMTRWVDSPAVIRLATRFGVSNDAKKLGELTHSMLLGPDGPHCEQYSELAKYLVNEIKPDIVVFSNSLLSGALPAVQDVFTGPVLCTLQGDDIFLDQLPNGIRQRVMDLLQHRVTGFDGYITHSRFYRNLMSRYLNAPDSKFHQLSISIDLDGTTAIPSNVPDRPFTVGYFARICPEKGLHQLLAAFQLLKKEIPDARLLAGGYLGPRDQEYFEGIAREASQFGDAFRYIGSPDRDGKWSFLDQIDVLSVPTVYQEPKGIYVLEALSRGVPVVLPSHGAFPELVESTQGGILCTPGDPHDLAEKLRQLAIDPSLRFSLGERGRTAISTRFTHRALAQQTLQLFQLICKEKSH